MKNQILKLFKQKSSPNDKKIGLALGGGAVLGAAHVGVLRTLEEYEVPIAFISGTSIGAFVAALYSFGLGWKEIQEIALDLDWLDISVLSLSKFGLLRNNKLGSMLDEKLGDVEFSDSKIPLAVIATDIANGKKVMISKGKVAEAVMASTCIPGLFIPIEKDEQMLVDGGVMENVPVPALQEMGADYIIGVDLNAKQSFEKPQNIVEVLMNTANLTLLNATRLQIEKADLLLSPDLSKFNLYDPGQVSELIETGYLESRKMIKKVFKRK